MRKAPARKASSLHGLKTLSRSIESSDELLHVIFHELRTPLSSIHGYASILLSGELGPLTQPQRETVERLRELTLYLTALITNLRQLALLVDEPTMIPWEPLDLDKVVRSVCDDLGTQARRKGIRLALQLSNSLPPLWAERNGITQVLINLIMNAIKFTPQRGKVTVAVRGSNHAVHLIVRDTGVGIPRAVIPKLFREFYHQDKPEVGAVGGTGLGLVIVKRSVDRHRGSVSVTSRLGRGSTFRVVLPQRSGQEIIKTVVEQMIQRSRQERQPFALLLIKAGRVRYERLERVLKESIRADDRYYPVQKPQLVVIVAQTNSQGAQVIAQRISYRIQRDPVLRRNRQLKVLLGIAAYPTHGRRAQQLLKVAHDHLAPLPKVAETTPAHVV